MDTRARPEFPPFTYPHLCSHLSYDGLGFHDFPSRLGWEISGALFTHPDHRGAIALSSQLALLQSWLFFGLIAEISRISGLSLSLDAEFLVDDGKQVSTAALNGLAQRWVQADKATQVSENVKLRGSEVYACYERVDFMLRNWKNTRRDDNWRWLTIPECRMLLSIGMLRRVIILTTEYYSGKAPRIKGLDIVLGWDENRGLRFDVPGELELRQSSEQRLRQRGWCPSEVEMLERTWQRHVHFFASVLERKVVQDHDRCNGERYAADHAQYNFHLLHIPIAKALGQVLGRPDL